MQDPETDEAYVQGMALAKVAQSTEACGLLLQLLTDERKKTTSRRGCQQLLRIVDQEGLCLPAPLRERAVQCVRMDL